MFGNPPPAIQRTQQTGRAQIVLMPLASRINTTKYALHFPLDSRVVSCSSPRQLELMCLRISGFHVWCEDACASLGNFYKRPASVEELPEWREEASMQVLS